MNPSEKIVVSASRRTDIPAFYMEWFMGQIDNGVFEVINPYNRRVSRIPASPEAVHTLVFWSKNFGPFLSGSFGERLSEKGYHLYFSFTINSDNPLLEPNLPPLTERLNQLKALSGRFQSDCIDWRFDPICFYKTEDGTIHNNLKDFKDITTIAARCGIQRCITSFMDHYRKIQKRVNALNGFSFMDPCLKEKRALILKLKKTLEKKNIQLNLCCEKDVLEALPEAAGIKQSACIPNHRLKALFGGNISLNKDRGQRIRAGCGCRVSVDIGSYDLHPCFHNCLFCYANPAGKKPKNNLKAGESEKARSGETEN